MAQSILQKHQRGEMVQRVQRVQRVQGRFGGSVGEHTGSI